jgi:hypothetical protein
MLLPASKSAVLSPSLFTFFALLAGAVAGCSGADASTEAPISHENVAEASQAITYNWFFATSLPNGDAVALEIIDKKNVRLFFCGGSATVQTNTKWFNGPLNPQTSDGHFSADVVAMSGAPETRHITLDLRWDKTFKQSSVWEMGAPDQATHESSKIWSAPFVSVLDGYSGIYETFTNPATRTGHVGLIAFPKVGANGATPACAWSDPWTASADCVAQGAAFVGTQADVVIPIDGKGGKLANDTEPGTDATITAKYLNTNIVVLRPVQPVP